MAISIHRPAARPFALIACETLLIIMAIATSAHLRLGLDGWTSFFFQDNGLGKALVITGICQLSLYYRDLYDLRSSGDRRDVFVRLLQALGSTSIILALVYFWLPDLIIGRGVFLWACGMVLALVVGWRMAFDWWSSHAAPSERLLIVGTSAAAVSLARELFERRRELGVEIVGFIDPDPQMVGAPLLNPGIIGTVEDIPSIVRARSVDRVVVSLADARGKLPLDKLLEMKLSRGITFDHLPTVYEQFTGKIAIENLRPSWLIFSEGFRQARFFRAAKRFCDITAASAMLLLLAPVMAAVAVLVRLTSPGPVVYQQVRVGQHGRVFKVRKFRSMRADAEAATGAVWATQNDTRITPVGRLIRRSRLDELPQLWNVLVGDMSLIGPRPERPEFVKMLTERIPFYGERHVIRPGLTGWAQVRYCYGASVEDAMEKLQYDLFYMKHMSLALDLVIAFETAKTVILRRGAA
ncbi:MAG: TIGR03013 family PEP-CTERM/XrtA system glycosyltransferase [Luteitalea sp.]|nr:TIGR03013 family PEP-CTERM/XrtA system glycosyltransferase [Luteitalea sp.]